MKYKGVIFDFNGTLFWDTDLHNKAWLKFASNHGQKLTKEELKVKLHGKVNRDILEYLFKKN
jgi:beta-phosphoglucomutase-like phosphatase (HAD superfamily)